MPASPVAARGKQMNKMFFVYAAVVAIAATSFAFAQSARTGGGSQIADTSSLATAQRVPANAAQEVMSRHFSTYQLYLLEQSEHQPQHEDVILALNVADMWVLTPAQQKDSQKNVLQLDKYMPSPSPWDAVRNAPSRIKALLNITEAQTAAIRKIEKAYRGSDQKIHANPKGQVEILKLFWADDESESKEVRAVLTADQQKEWDAIRAAGVKLMTDAFNKRKP
jgi:hypothetical protein